MSPNGSHGFSGKSGETECVLYNTMIVPDFVRHRTSSKLDTLWLTTVHETRMAIKFCIPSPPAAGARILETYTAIIMQEISTTIEGSLLLEYSRLSILITSTDNQTPSTVFLSLSKPPLTTRKNDTTQFASQVRV
jgi:uncharacterized membrane protein